MAYAQKILKRLKPETVKIKSSTVKFQTMECASFRIIFTTSILPEFEINVKKYKGLDFLFDYRTIIQSVRKLKLVHIKEGRILLIAGIKGKMVMRIFKRFVAFVSNLGLKTRDGEKDCVSNDKNIF